MVTLNIACLYFLPFPVLTKQHSKKKGHSSCRVMCCHVIGLYQLVVVGGRGAVARPRGLVSLLPRGLAAALSVSLLLFLLLALRGATAAAQTLRRLDEVEEEEGKINRRDTTDRWWMSRNKTVFIAFILKS